MIQGRICENRNEFAHHLDRFVLGFFDQRIVRILLFGFQDRLAQNAIVHGVSVAF